MRRATQSLFIFCILVTLSNNPISAQFWETYSQRIGYFGNNVINPGILYGLERNMWDSKQSEKFSLPFGRSTIDASGNAALYWDPFSHTAFVNYYELSVRQYFGRRLGIQFGVGPGFQLNFTSDNYIVDEDFNVSKRGVKVNAYPALEFSSALFLANRANDKHWISKFSLFLLGRYNTGVLPVINYEYIYQF